MNKTGSFISFMTIICGLTLCFLNTLAAANDKIIYENGGQPLRFARNFRFEPDNNYQNTENTVKTNRNTDRKNIANDINGFFVGLTYPGVTAGYQGQKFGLEIRTFLDSEIKVYGPRFTHYAADFKGGKLYWGIDLFKISEFEGDLTEGDGLMYGAFIGIQKYLGSRFSLTLDSGPYNIALEDNLSGKDVNGLEFVVNTGLNFHF